MSNEFTLEPFSLHRYTEWKQLLTAPKLSLWDYLNHHGNLELAAIFSKLFWPSFIEVKGCIFLEEQYELQSFEDWLAVLGEDRKKLESTINHVHIYDLFHNSEDRGFELQLAAYLGGVLLKSWKCALHEAYPDKEFEFYYASEPEEYGPTLSFHQKVSVS